MSLYDDHVTHDKQLRSLISQVTNGRRRGAIVDKELSLNGVTWRGIFELLRVLDPQNFWKERKLVCVRPCRGASIAPLQIFFVEILKNFELFHSYIEVS